MVTGTLPCSQYRDNPRRFVQEISAGNFEYPRHLSKECENLLRSILTCKPDKRPKIDAIRKDPWVNKGHFRSPTCYLPIRPTVTEIDDVILDQLVVLGFTESRKKMQERILSNKRCQLVATYHLLLEQHVAKNPPKIFASSSADINAQKARKKSNSVFDFSRHTLGRHSSASLANEFHNSQQQQQQQQQMLQPQPPTPVSPHQQSTSVSPKAAARPTAAKKERPARGSSTVAMMTGIINHPTTWHGPKTNTPAVPQPSRNSPPSRATSNGKQSVMLSQSYDRGDQEGGVANYPSIQWSPRGRHSNDSLRGEFKKGAFSTRSDIVMITPPTSPLINRDTCGVSSPSLPIPEETVVSPPSTRRFSLLRKSNPRLSNLGSMGMLKEILSISPRRVADQSESASVANSVLPTYDEKPTVISEHIEVILNSPSLEGKITFKRKHGKGPYRWSCTEAVDKKNKFEIHLERSPLNDGTHAVRFCHFRGDKWAMKDLCQCIITALSCLLSENHSPHSPSSPSTPRVSAMTAEIPPSEKEEQTVSQNVDSNRKD
eukprot:TRINITY_DN663_c1_g1_i1.p1 TRINITY_DN663_c1_g1~~TRINITY_DN663_c1_g1_i1.p1  ORF type:complete len:545 (+),score=138.68 TRINITY_DN663_c1_g1_i1:645-2279(+)